MAEWLAAGYHPPLADLVPRWPEVMPHTLLQLVVHTDPACSPVMILMGERWPHKTVVCGDGVAVRVVMRQASQTGAFCMPFGAGERLLIQGMRALLPGSNLLPIPHAMYDRYGSVADIHEYN